MSRCEALKELRSRREGRANWQFALPFFIAFAPPCFYECGTLTITELLELDPAESVTVNVIVYILPEPLPERSARNRT